MMAEKKKFCCEYCYQPIGFVDLDKLADPMTPDMFSSLMPENGVPDPFHPSLEWIDFKCPYCRLRPFITEGWMSLIDDRGNQTRIDISKIEKKKEYKCECGKVCKSEAGLKRHKAACNG